MKDGDYFEDLGVDGIILKLVLKIGCQKMYLILLGRDRYKRRAI